MLYKDSLRKGISLEVIVEEDDLQEEVSHLPYQAGGEDEFWKRGEKANRKRLKETERRWKRWRKHRSLSCETLTILDVGKDELSREQWEEEAREWSSDEEEERRGKKTSAEEEKAKIFSHNISRSKIIESSMANKYPLAVPKMGNSYNDVDFMDELDSEDEDEEIESLDWREPSSTLDDQRSIHGNLFSNTMESASTLDDQRSTQENLFTNTMESASTLDDQRSTHGNLFSNTIESASTLDDQRSTQENLFINKGQHASTPCDQRSTHGNLFSNTIESASTLDDQRSTQENLFINKGQHASTPCDQRSTQENLFTNTRERASTADDPRSTQENLFTNLATTFQTHGSWTWGELGLDTDTWISVGDLLSMDKELTKESVENTEEPSTTIPEPNNNYIRNILPKEGSNLPDGIIEAHLISVEGSKHIFDKEPPKDSKILMAKLANSRELPRVTLIENKENGKSQSQQEGKQDNSPRKLSSNNFGELELKEFPPPNTVASVRRLFERLPAQRNRRFDHVQSNPTSKILRFDRDKNEPSSFSAAPSRDHFPSTYAVTPSSRRASVAIGVSHSPMPSKNPDSKGISLRKPRLATNFNVKKALQESPRNFHARKGKTSFEQDHPIFKISEGSQDQSDHPIFKISKGSQDQSDQSLVSLSPFQWTREVKTNRSDYAESLSSDSSEDSGVTKDLNSAILSKFKSYGSQRAPSTAREYDSQTDIEDADEEIAQQSFKWIDPMVLTKIRSVGTTVIYFGPRNNYDQDTAVKRNRGTVTPQTFSGKTNSTPTLLKTTLANQKKTSGNSEDVSRNERTNGHPAEMDGFERNQGKTDDAKLNLNSRNLPRIVGVKHKEPVETAGINEESKMAEVGRQRTKSNLSKRTTKGNPASGIHSVIYNFTCT